MKTGIDSLDTGAPDITYEGNQGPKSPQEDQRMMQEFQMQQQMEQMAGGENDRVRELLLLEETQGLSEEQKEELRQLIKTISVEMPQGGIGDMPMDMEQDPRTMAADGGIMRTGFRGGGMDAGAGSNFGSENFGGNGDNNNQPTYSPPPRGPAELGISSKSPDAPPEPDDRGTVEQNLNQARVLINAQLEPTAFNKVKNFIPYIGTLSRLGILPNAEKKMAIARKNDLLRDLYKVNQTGNMITPEFFDTEEGEKYLRDAGVFDGPGLGDNKDGPPIILPPVMPMTTGMTTADADPEDLGTEFISQFTRNALTDADKERISNIGGKSIFLADGGMARERAAFGGIMGDDGRRAYGLGSIFKKAARAIKKVAKSPVGKVALMYAGGKFLGGGDNFFGNLRPSFLGNLGSFVPGQDEKTGFFNKLLRQKNDKGFYKKFDPFKVGIAGLSALTYLKSKQDEDDEPSLDEYMGSASRGPSLNPSGIREYIAANKGRVDPNQYAFLNKDFYAADGGRIGYADGLKVEDEDEDEKGSFRSQALGALYKQLAFGGSAGMPPVTLKAAGIDMQSFGDDESKGMDQGPTMKSQMPIQKPMMDPKMMQMMMAQQGGQGRMMAAMGGRMNYNNGGGAGYSFGYKPGKEFQLNVGSMGKGTIKEIINSGELNSEDLKAAMDALRDRKAMGGRMDYAEGGESEELLDMGGMEKDYRNDGGFVPMGEYERKDDVPARLSKNEFVFTADAVRNAGAGDIDKGAEIMENMMKNLENGGQVSQGSQGLDGAREMFQTQQRLGEVL